MLTEPQTGRPELPMISLRGLECLVAVTEQGSLTKAAAVRGVVLPSQRGARAARVGNRP
jgi:hypothetical protein